MRVKLPIPIFVGTEKYKEVEIDNPLTDTVFKTKKIIDQGDYFSGMKTFVENSIIAIDKITDKEKIKRLISECPVNTIEYLAIKIMLLEYPDDDKVEGIYVCPRCGQQKISELKNEIDTRDSIEELEVNYYQGKNEIEFEVNPIEIKNKQTKESILVINSLAIRFPTIRDLIEAANKVGFQNAGDIQKEMYKKCILKLNGQDADKKEINKYGNKIIEKMRIKDLNKFGLKIKEYGMDNTVVKICNNCNKEWEAKINTSNFFVSALPSS